MVIFNGEWLRNINQGSYGDGSKVLSVARWQNFRLRFDELDIDVTDQNKATSGGLEAKLGFEWAFA